MNESNSKSSGELAILLENAFSTDHPPDVFSMVFDNSDYHDECRQIRQLLQGVTWQEIDTSLALQLRGCFGFLTPQAFIYFLPGFINVSLLDYDNADTIPGEVFYSLSPQGGLHKDIIGDVSARTWELITPDKAQVICQCLRGIISRHFEDFPGSDKSYINSAIEFWCLMPGDSVE